MKHSVLRENILESKNFRHHQTEIPVSWQLDDEEDEPADYGHVLLPVVVSHIIDQDSPLYNLAPADFNKAK